MCWFMQHSHSRKRMCMPSRENMFMGLLVCNVTVRSDCTWETVEKPAHVTRELFGADTGGGTKEHPLKEL